MLARAEMPTEQEKQYFEEFRKAVNEKDEDQIDLLIRKEGIVRKYFDEEGTFLNVVADRGSVETAIKISKLGADINFSDNGENTAIFFATNNSAEMVTFCVENGADVNFRNLNDETPLHYAIRKSAKMVKILLENGAEAHVADDHGITLLHEALLNGTEEIVRLILNKILSKIRSDYKEVESTKEIVTLIFENKENLKIVEKDYPLLVFSAAKLGNVDIFQLVLSEIRNCLDMKNNTESSKRRKSCNIKTINSTRFPEELNLRSYFDRTALHYAVRQQLPKVVCFLLKAGADPDCKTEACITPLHIATCYANEKICKILLNFGANVNSTAPDVGSPISQVCGSNNVVDHLGKTDSYYFEEYEVHFWNTTFDLRIIKLLLDSGASPNIPGFEERTPVVEACGSGMMEVVKLFFQFNADFLKQDKKGNSALHYAAVGNCLEIVHFLLERGLDINIRNGNNCTPLLMLTQKYESRLLEVVEYLVDRGTDINAKDINGMTSLHTACIALESAEYVELLLELGANVKVEHEAEVSSDIDLPTFSSGRQTLISFIALNKKELEDYIVCYFEPYILNLPAALEYFDKCKLEIEKLKSTKIVEGTSVSFHDFLTGGFYNAVQIAKNEEIKKVFKSRQYFKEFTCYFCLLQKRFERAIALTEAVDRMANFLTNCLSALPALFIREILNLLSSSDFRKFDTNLSMSNSKAKQQLNLNLVFSSIFNSKIVEIRETGVMVSLKSDIPPVLLLNSQLNTDSLSHPDDVLNLKIGDNIHVMYQGRYPMTGEIRLTEKFRKS